MNVGAFAIAASRSPAGGAASSAAGAPGAPGADSARDAPSPLAILENFVESAHQSRKAFAEERLVHLKKQMNTLMLFDLAPGFLVSHSERMTRELQAAATDFAAATKALGSQESPRSQDAGLTATAQTDSGTETRPELPPAYLDILGGGDDQSGRVAGRAGWITAEDAETASGFVSVARHIRIVVDLAMEDAKPDDPRQSTAEAARNSTSRVIDIMTRLQGPAGAAPVYW